MPVIQILASHRQLVTIPGKMGCAYWVNGFVPTEYEHGGVYDVIEHVARNMIQRNPPWARLLTKEDIAKMGEQPREASEAGPPPEESVTPEDETKPAKKRRP